MEGLAYDFNTEDEEEDDQDTAEIKEKSPSLAISLIEALKNKPEKEDSKELSLSEEHESIEGLVEITDKAPELDSEAPLNYLSQEETKAVNQTIAADRLEEIQTADEIEITSETLAAESFLENVKANGDIETAYQETMAELNAETATKNPSLDLTVETETALPPDPTSLLFEAKKELRSLPSVKPKVDRQPITLEKEVKQSKPSKTEAQQLRLKNNIVDYLIGRRFGRIVAENKQPAVEESLSAEVNHLEQVITSHELQVRQVAQNKLIDKARQPKRKDETKTEVIGRVLIDAELPERPIGHRDELAGISAHTMKRQELLKIASAIKVEGSSLKQIYETHLVGEKGLRRIIAEYLRGGDFRKALKRELMEREKDFERDPKLRDQGSSQPIVPATTAALDKMLSKTGINWAESESMIGRQPKVKDSNLTALIDDFKKPSVRLRRVVDIVLVGLIISMATVIIILLLSR